MTATSGPVPEPPRDVPIPTQEGTFHGMRWRAEVLEAPVEEVDAQYVTTPTGEVRITGESWLLRITLENLGPKPRFFPSTSIFQSGEPVGWRPTDRASWGLPKELEGRPLPATLRFELPGEDWVTSGGRARIVPWEAYAVDPESLANLAQHQLVIQPGGTLLALNDRRVVLLPQGSRLRYRWYPGDPFDPAAEAKGEGFALELLSSGVPARLQARFVDP